MKKSLIALLSLTALMSITGCGGADSTVSPKPFKPSVPPSEVMLNSYSESLFVGETFSLELFITPLLASDAKFIFESSDTAVASVSSDGVIKAVGEGEAVISVYADRVNTVGKKFKVRVFEQNKDLRSLKSKMDKMYLYQRKYVKEPKKLLTEQIKTNTLYKNDNLFSVSTQYNTIMFSDEDAYVLFGGRDKYQHIEGGNESRDFGIYQIFCDEDYHSYIYHDGDNSRRYCPVKTEFNIGTENTQMDTVYSILDSLFTSGRKLVTNCVEDSLGSDWFDFASLAMSYGNKGDDELSINFHQESSKNVSTPLMEQNLDIPAYINYQESDDFEVYWDKGNVKTYISTFAITYYVNGVKHLLKIEERNTFTRDDVEVHIPTPTGYEKKDSVYDL